MRYRILGPVEALDGLRPVRIGAAKPRALLGVLLLHANEVVPTGRLVDELWGEEAPATATKLVQGYVHALRKDLGAGSVVTQPPGYRMPLEPDDLDLSEFRRLLDEARSAPLERAAELTRKALSLWRGPPLVDVELAGAARHEVGRLSELRLAAQIELLEAELELGRAEGLVGELELLVAAHPYQERLRGLLMLALYRSGRQAEALEAYQAARAMLAEELGLEPGQALRDLQSAILRQEATLGAEGSAPLPAAPERHEPPPDRGEPRPCTVLLADIVGTRALSERLPSGEAGALVGDCVLQLRRAVEEFGGTVYATEDDAVRACFGLPRAREDDPERAARAALRVLEVVGAYATDIAEAWAIPDFAIRIGIDTVRAVVGTRWDSDGLTMGDADEVAFALQRTAAPGSILVSAETDRRLSRRFELEPLEPLQIEGRTGAVPVSRLIGLARPDHGPRLRPLVGRARELDLLRSVVTDFETGRGRALLLVGEPGIGKTRMLAELRALVSDDATWLEGQCLSYGGWPFVDVLRRWLGIEPGDPEVVVRTRVGARLGSLFGEDVLRTLPGLARLVRIRVDPDVGIPVERTEARRAYVEWIAGLAERGSVVLALEDLHWAHASTRELAETLLELTDRSPLLLVVTLRRDQASEGWRFRTRVLTDYSHRATEIPLEPLAPVAAREILATLLPGALDDATVEDLVERAEGNPLFLEELLRALLEAGGLERRQRTWTTTLAPSVALPPALEGLLVARIDRLADGSRRVAQYAAVLGREFSVSMLEDVAGESTRDDLADLMRAEIVREVRRYPELVCAFRHGLLHEAALASLTPSRRRELYGVVASALEGVDRDSLDDQVERLAHYHAQSGDLEAARAHLQRAAARAEELGADSRAADLRERAARLRAEVEGAAM